MRVPHQLKNCTTSKREGEGAEDKELIFELSLGDRMQVICRKRCD